VSHNQHYLTCPHGQHPDRCGACNLSAPTPFYDEDGITIYNADCLELGGLLDEAAVMVTDPPYGYAYASNQGGKFKGQMIANDESLDARDAVLEAWGSKPALVFGSWKAPRPAATREVIVWDKGDVPGMGDLKLPWGASHEEIYVLGAGFTGKRGGTVLRVNRVVTWNTTRHGRSHPNEKPIALMRILLSRCPEGTIIDPFMGSGTTLRAAKDLGRRAIGVELSREFCEIAVQRLGQEVLDVG
jgi:DNA modification methylase